MGWQTGYDDNWERDKGCGLYFCDDHLVTHGNLCDRCRDEKEPCAPKPDTLEWISWKFHHESLGRWREEDPEKVAELKQRIEQETGEVKL
jgi:hypothetical protein